MNKQNLFVIIFLIISSHSLLAHENFSSKIFAIDKNNVKKVVVGARIYNTETKQGAVSDQNGKFSFEIERNSDTIIASYISYKKDTTTIQKIIDEGGIFLKELEFKTNEINVDGEKGSSTISFTDINKSETINARGLLKAACCNLSESFATNASVDVNYTDAVSGAKQIELLGLSGNYTQILIEKIQSIRGLSLPFGLGFVPGTWMESIQISKGTGSVASGPESMTGQINVEYKKPQDGNPPLLNLFASNEGRFELNYDRSFEISEHLQTGLFVHASKFANERDNHKDGFMDAPKFSQFNLMNRWKFEFGNFEGQFVVKYLYDEKFGGTLRDSRAENLKFETEIFTNRFEIDGKIGTVLDQDNYESIALMYSLISHDHRSKFASRIFDANSKSALINLLYEKRIMEEKHKFSLGASYMYDDYRENISIYNSSLVHSMPGLFAEYTNKMFENFSAVFGIRADNHNKYGSFYTPRLHLKYNFSETSSLRFSAGSGMRIPYFWAENISLLASNKTFDFEEELKVEKNRNFGLNFTTLFELFGKELQISAELYRTDFQNQVIIDREEHFDMIHVYNLRGKSYSNSAQIDITYEPIKRFVITTAFRYNEVKMTINGDLLDKALSSKTKSFINLEYSTEESAWKFDFTLVRNGEGRIINNIDHGTGVHDFPKTFDAYYIANSQINKDFEDFSLYLGVENIGDFVQEHAILFSEDPTNKFFDASMIWGPLMGRTIYAGLRLHI